MVLVAQAFQGKLPRQPANADMSDPILDPLLALIKERGLLDDLQLEEVLQEQSRSGKSIGQILSDFQLVDMDTQLQIIAEHMGTSVVNIAEMELTPEILRTVPAGTARMYQCVPVAVYGNAVQVALVNPLNPSIIDELGFTVGKEKELQLVVADPNSIEKLIEKYYGEDTDDVSNILAELGADLEEEVKEAGDDAGSLADLANETPIIRFVNLVLFQAVQDRASDIHFEPFEDEFKIRYRVDGALYEMAP